MEEERWLEICSYLESRRGKVHKTSCKYKKNSKVYFFRPNIVILEVFNLLSSMEVVMKHIMFATFFLDGHSMIGKTSCQAFYKFLRLRNCPCTYHYKKTVKKQVRNNKSFFYPKALSNMRLCLIWTKWNQVVWNAASWCELVQRCYSHFTMWYIVSNSKIVWINIDVIFNVLCWRQFKAYLYGIKRR